MHEKSVLIVYSYHHHNTEKIAQVISNVLDCAIKNPTEVNPKDLEQYDLIGFGSGIYSARHHQHLLDLAEKITQSTEKKAFLFSTAGITSKTKAEKDHSLLREKLQSKGFQIVDEFQCKGYNTNSFLKYFGGMNKGRPNDDDFKHVEEFAKKLQKNDIIQIEKN